MPADVRAAYFAMRRAGQAAFPPPCLEYLYRLIYLAAFNGKTFRDLAPAELTAILRRRIAADFGAMGAELLERWGLRTSRDLGRAVHALADHGCLALRTGENGEDYADESLLA